MNELIADNMITYKALQNRSDIALISDDVSSREELIESLMKYLKLTRKQRRYSDYYSVKIFGCNVSDMFFTLCYRFKFESPIPVNETLLISEPALYYNKKAFADIEKVSLDDLVCVKDHYTLDELKNLSDMLYAFFTGTGAKYYISKKERDLFSDRSEVFVEFIKFAKKYASSHKENKFILEGIWIYLFFEDPSKFDKYAVYMKGTSLIKSKFRRMIRESSNTPIESWDRLIEFGIYAGDTTLKDGNVDKWRRHFEKKRETVIKEEENYFTLLKQNIMAQINNINDCFVHEDRAGIESIMKRASSNCKMDITEKAIVIEECKRAIADLA